MTLCLAVEWGPSLTLAPDEEKNGRIREGKGVVEGPAGSERGIFSVISKLEYRAREGMWRGWLLRWGKI